MSSIVVTKKSMSPRESRVSVVVTAAHIVDPSFRV